MGDSRISPETHQTMLELPLQSVKTSDTTEEPGQRVMYISPKGSFGFTVLL